MANSLLTISMITRKALQLFRNSNVFLKLIDRQYDSEFGKTPKIGNQLRIRLPNEFTVRSGPVAVPQSTNEQQVVLTVGTMKGVDVSFSSTDLTLSLDDSALVFLHRWLTRWLVRSRLILCPVSKACPISCRI